jgi:hypothetical protein
MPIKINRTSRTPNIKKESLFRGLFQLVDKVDKLQLVANHVPSYAPFKSSP